MWLRIFLVVVFFFAVIFTATFGMGGLRSSIEQARAEGKSEEYVTGMAARSWQMRSARIEVVIYAFGLLVVGLAGYVGRRHLHSRK